MNAERMVYELGDLLYLMARLRKPETGCPWDIKQDFLSITPSTLEEVYEVVDAIERADYGHLEEELGDLLFQIIFYAQLAAEEGRFDFNSIVDTLTEKLVRRHPHVFPEANLRAEFSEGQGFSEQEIRNNWDAIKQLERLGKGESHFLADIPLALPALQYAQKLQKRVSKLGMDWDNAEAVYVKLEEEMLELKHAMVQKDAKEIRDELGDVLFSCVNLARHLNIDANGALREANQKFKLRLDKMDGLLQTQSQTWKDCDAEKLDLLWQSVKVLER